MEYSNQENFSNILVQINGNNTHKMDFIIKSAIKNPDQTKKCAICKKIQILESLIVCKFCEDNFHLDCFNNFNETQYGRFFHRSEIEHNTFNYEKQESKVEIKSSDDCVYWACHKCSNQILKKERIQIELRFPFEVQEVPQRRFKKRYFYYKKSILAYICNYCIPKNFEIALEEKKLMFNDECIFLSTAKTFHNSVAFSNQPIDVFF